MQVSHNAATTRHHLPGLEHQTLAGRRDGLGTLEVWRQTIAAGASTPVHRHDCEEVIVILGGQGVCRAEGRECAFQEDDTLIIPANLVHQIANTGTEDLYIIATLAMAPVKVETGGGEPMPLPWDASAA